MLDWLASTLLWSGLTVIAFRLAVLIHRRWRHWLTTPLLITSLSLIALLLALGVRYADYHAGTEFLVLMLGPATVAFAVPIYEQRTTIRQHWRLLAVAVVVGSATSMVSTWGLAALFGIERTLWLNMLPRNISMPFSMPIADVIGGQAELASVFVALSGTLGITLGDILLLRLPRYNDMSYGAAFGACSHAAGAAKAQQRSNMAGAVAGIVMILTGLANVFFAPVLGWLLK